MTGQGQAVAPSPLPHVPALRIQARPPWPPLRHGPGRTVQNVVGERREGGRGVRPADTSQFHIEMQVGKYLCVFFWPRCCVTLRRNPKNTQGIVCSFHFVVCNYCIPKKEIACLRSLLISFFSFELQVSGKLRDHYCYLVAPIFHQI